MSADRTENGMNRPHFQDDLPVSATILTVTIGIRGGSGNPSRSDAPEVETAGGVADSAPATFFGGPILAGPARRLNLGL
jgi:hypothetical protein